MTYAFFTPHDFRMKSLLTNILLLIITAILVVLLFRYTDFPKSGLVQGFKQSYHNLEKIWKGSLPSSSLLAEEKEKIIESFPESDEVFKLFCDNSYFPFIPGANWRYKVTDGLNTDQFSLGIPSPEGNNYFLDGRMESWKNWTSRTIFSCRDNLIRITDLNFLQIFRNIEVTTTPCENNTLSFYLPSDKDLSGGKAWKENGCLKITSAKEENKTENSIVKNIDLNWKVLGREKIATPAGEFDTIKIEIYAKISEKASEISKNIEERTVLYLAKGVGVVKIINEEVSQNGRASEKPQTVQELMSFQIPTEKEYKIVN